MRLKTFTAPDMNRAMLMIRETMGDDAVIISTTRDSSGKTVSVTAAVEEENPFPAANDWQPEETASDTVVPRQSSKPSPVYPVGGLGAYLTAVEKHKRQPAPAEQPPQKPRPEPSSVSPPPWLNTQDGGAINRESAYLLHELEQCLLYHSLPPALIERMLRAARHLQHRYPSTLEGVEQALADILEGMLDFAPLELESPAQAGKAPRIMLVGPAGTGKTLAVAKIAAHRVADDLPIRIITIDNRKAGSVEQLRAFSHIMGLEVEVADSRAELRQLLRESPADVPVVMDAFGTNPYSFDELKELTDFANLHEIEPVLVLAAGSDAQEAIDTAQAYSFLGVRRLLMTRADAARRLGAVLSAAENAGIALSEMTSSPQVAGGIQSLDAPLLARVLMRHKTEQ